MNANSIIPLIPLSSLSGLHQVKVAPSTSDRVHEVTASVMGLDSSKPDKVAAPKKVATPISKADNKLFVKQAVALMKKESKSQVLIDFPDEERISSLFAGDDILHHLFHFGLKGVKNAEVEKLSKEYQGIGDNFTYALIRFQHAKRLLEQVVKTGHPAIQTLAEKQGLLNIYLRRLHHLEYVYDLNRDSPRAEDVEQVVSKIQEDIDYLDKPSSKRIFPSANGIRSFSILGRSIMHIITYEFQKEGDHYYFVIHNRGERWLAGENIHGSCRFDFDGVRYDRTSIRIKTSKEVLMNPEFIKTLVATQFTDTEIPYAAIQNFLITTGGGVIVRSQAELLIENLSSCLSSPILHEISPGAHERLQELMRKLIRIDPTFNGQQFYGTCGESNLSEDALAPGSTRAALKLHTLTHLTSELVDRRLFDISRLEAGSQIHVFGRTDRVQTVEEYRQTAHSFIQQIGKKQAQLIAKLAKRKIEGELPVDIAATITAAQSLLASINSDFISKTTPEFLSKINSLDKLLSFLHTLTPELKNNKAFMLNLIHHLSPDFTLYIVAHASHALMSDPEFVAGIVRRKFADIDIPVGISLADLNRDPRIAAFLALIQSSSTNFPFLRNVAKLGTKDEILSNLQIFHAQSYPAINCTYLIAALSPDLRNDAEFMKAVINIRPASYEFFHLLSDTLKNNLNFVVYAVKKAQFLIWVLADSHHPLINHPEVIKAAIPSYIEALQFASPALKKNKAFLLEIVQLNGMALQELQRALKKVPIEFHPQAINPVDIEKAAIHQNPLAIQFASERIKNDLEIAKNVVARNGLALEHLSADMRNHPEVVKIAMLQNVKAFQFASLALKKNKAFLLEIVQLNGLALGELQVVLKKVPIEFHPKAINPKDIEIAAINQNVLAIQFASKYMQNDLAMAKYVVARDGLALEHVSVDMRNHPEVVIIATRQNLSALQLASPALRNNKVFMLLLTTMNPYALFYASDELKRDPDIIAVMNILTVPAVSN